MAEMNRRMRVVEIVRWDCDLIDYPEAREDTEAYPHLRDWVRDDIGLLVIDVHSGKFWQLNDFFYSVDVREFLVDEKDLGLTEVPQVVGMKPGG